MELLLAHGADVNAKDSDGCGGGCCMRMGACGQGHVLACAGACRRACVSCACTRACECV